MEYLNKTTKFMIWGDFPADPVFRNLPATVGNAAWISGLGRFCVP